MDTPNYQVRYGDVRVAVYDVGWQRQPWAKSTDPDVFGYRVVVMLGDPDDVANLRMGGQEWSRRVYDARAYGSIAEAMEYHDDDDGTFEKGWASIGAMVCDELVSYWVDPDSFAALLAEGVTDGESLKRAAGTLKRLEDASDIAEALYWWADGDFGYEPEAFEKEGTEW